MAAISPTGSDEQYIPTVTGGTGLLGIPKVVANAERTGQITEALAIESYHDVYPAVFETVINGKLLRDEDSQKMFKLLMDGPVELLEIGYPQVLAALCAHPQGYRLLSEKVPRLWMMAGNWLNNGMGVENNIARGPMSRRAASYLFEHCPCPIVFLGWEVGASVISGTPVTIPDPSDPLRMAFAAHGSRNGRSSWDPMLVLLALTGNIEKAGYTIRRGYASADPETGENRFRYADDGPHGYVVKAMPDSWYAEALAEWLQ